MVKEFKKHKLQLIVVAGILLFLFAEIFFLFANVEQDGDVSPQSLQAYAHTALELCKNEPHRPSCYEEHIPNFLDEVPIQKVFEIIRLVQEGDTSYRYCHVLGHELGEREVSKDPKNWFDVIPKCPSDGLCSNGCVHGAAMERFSDEILTDEEIEAIIPDLAIACEAREGYAPTPLDQAICYHGIGHLNAHLTEARVEKSLEICDRIVVKEDGRNYARVCMEGVFMQYFQPLEPEDYALIDQLDMELNKETLPEFCATHSRTVEEEGACMREAWPLYHTEIQTAEGIMAFCDLSPSSEESKCYESVLSIVGRGSLDDVEKIAQICNGLTETWQSQCYAIAGTVIVEEDRRAGTEAAAFCEAIASESNRTACYNRLVELATFNFHPTDPNLRMLCEALPSPWNTQCLQKVRL